MSVLKLDQLVDKITDYFKVKIDLIKLDLIEQGSNFTIRVLAMMIIVGLSLLAVLFVSLGLVMLLNSKMDSVFVGYFIVGGLFVILIGLCWILFKKGILQGFLAEQILEDLEEKEKNNG